jgi:4-nitrophenyl phosphatase/NagD protein
MVMDDFGYGPEETVMIGDRIYTDIECGLRAGVDTYLVLSGETTADMVPDSHSYEVVNNIGSIIEIIERGNTV